MLVPTTAIARNSISPKPNTPVFAILENKGRHVGDASSFRLDREVCWLTVACLPLGSDHFYLSFRKLHLSCFSVRPKDDCLVNLCQIYCLNRRLRLFMLIRLPFVVFTRRRKIITTFLSRGQLFRAPRTFSPPLLFVFFSSGRKELLVNIAIVHVYLHRFFVAIRLG